MGQVSVILGKKAKGELWSNCVKRCGHIEKGKEEGQESHYSTSSLPIQRALCALSINQYSELIFYESIKIKTNFAPSRFKRTDLKFRELMRSTS